MPSMICRKCDQRAVIRMRQHRLALCKDHYPHWVSEQTQRFIEKYNMFTREEPVLVAVSGGKDSLALWDVLWLLGYRAEGLYIHLGIQGDAGYSDRSQVITEQFAARRSLTLHIENVQTQTGETIPDLALRHQRGRQKPCAVCGLVKRHTMNRVASQLNFPVLATAHNLDDEAAFLFGNTLSWNTGQMARQSPVLPAAQGFVRKVKPFFRFTERETAAYAIVRGIDYIEEECPYAEGSKQLQYKALLNRLEEEQAGFKLRFMVEFLEARGQGLFRSFEDRENNIALQACPSCGQLTSRNTSCAYCAMFEQHSP